MIRSRRRLAVNGDKCRHVAGASKGVPGCRGMNLTSDDFIGPIKECTSYGIFSSPKSQTKDPVSLSQMKLIPLPDNSFQVLKQHLLRTTMKINAEIDTYSITTSVRTHDHRNKDFLLFLYLTSGQKYQYSASFTDSRSYSPQAEKYCNYGKVNSEDDSTSVSSTYPWKGVRLLPRIHCSRPIVYTRL